MADICIPTYGSRSLQQINQYHNVSIASAAAEPFDTWKGLSYQSFL